MGMIRSMDVDRIEIQIIMLSDFLTLIRWIYLIIQIIKAFNLDFDNDETIGLQLRSSVGFSILIFHPTFLQK